MLVSSRRLRGFSLVELVAVVVVIGVLAAVLFKMSIDYAEQAEKIAMEQVASGVRAALHLRVAGLIATNADDAIPTLAKQNPMDWLADKPHLYVGDFYGDAPLELAPPRSWYYDRRVHELVYRVLRTTHLEAPNNPHNDIRFKVWAEQGALPGGEMLNKALRGIRRLEFAPIEPYRWSINSL